MVEQIKLLLSTGRFALFLLLFVLFFILLSYNKIFNISYLLFFMLRQHSLYKSSPIYWILPKWLPGANKSNVNQGPISDN